MVLPLTSNLYPGRVEPIPTFPLLRIVRRSVPAVPVLALLLVLAIEKTPTVLRREKWALPSPRNLISPLSTSMLCPLPADPTTCRGLIGAVLPIPTLPEKTPLPATSSF